MEKCKAELHIADDYGDNHATMRCQLDEGHDGSHAEHWKSDDARYAPRSHRCTVTWEGSDKRTEEDEAAEASLLKEFWHEE